MPDNINDFNKAMQNMPKSIDEAFKMRTPTLQQPISDTSLQEQIEDIVFEAIQKYCKDVAKKICTVNSVTMEIVEKNAAEIMTLITPIIEPNY